MKQRSSLTLAILVFIVLTLLPGAAPTSRAQAPDPVNPYLLLSGPFVARVYYERVEDIARLAEFDVFEYNNVREKYVLVAVDAAGYRDLQALGFRVQVDEKETASFRKVPVIQPWQVNGIPGYPCYRTVEETYASAQAIVAAHPDLATWSDVGDSWEKTAGLGGYDMRVLKLTNSAIPGPKPKLFVTGAIHAREYTTAELVTRFGEYLINNHGVDADATWLLDWHEIHLMLQTNPDGRKEAETGLSWRKNTNQNYCGATSTSRGADLNRNFAFYWNGCTPIQGCSSGSQCNETYRGPGAASEPETQAVQNYMRAIFPDQRADPITSPAPADATGVYMDIHSYSDLVLWPWGFTSTVAPNGTAMQTLGRKFAYFNGYTPEQSIGLYATDGTTDDFAYGDLGVAAFTIELGNAFFESCSTFESSVLPTNMPALLYAAKVVRTPYLTPPGSDALNVTTSPVTVTLGSPATLTASINDTRYNQTNGTEPTQNIAAAEYYVDVPPWDTAHSPVAITMSAADGSFNSTIENVTASVNTAGLTPGRHILFVRGQDAAGNWGAFSAAFVNVTMISTSPASQAVCAPAAASYTISVGYSGSVTFSASGHPAGTTVAFLPNPVAGPGSSVLTIGNTGAAAAGSYTIVVTGTAGSMAQANSVRLDLSIGTPAGPALVSPANAATNVATTPTFSWNAVAGASSYTLEIATDPTFVTIAASASGLTGTSFTPPAALNTGALFYWRVRAVSACGTSPYAAIFHFSTAAAPGDCSVGATPNVLLSQGFEAGAGGWTHSGTGDTWAIWGANVHSGSAAFHANDPATTSDQRLVSPAVALPAGQNPVVLKLWHAPNLEPSGTTACYDGGILEVSTDGGTTWTQVPNASLLVGPYRGTVSSSFGNPLAGLQAWCGTTTYINTIANVDLYAGQTVQFRMRLGSDTSASNPGWDVDDVVVQACQACATPATVTGVTISRSGSSQVQVAWSAAAGATYYEVWYTANRPYFTPGADCGNPAPYGCAYVAGTSFLHASVGDPAQNYSYVIRAGNACAAVSPALSGRVGEFDYGLMPGD